MKLDQFLELFNPLPGNHYLQVCTQKDEISKSLEKILDGVGGEFKLILYNKDHLNFSQPFRALPRENDSVILQDVLSSHKNPDMLIKIAYTTLANTADIILLEKKENMSIEQMKELLEKHEFRAINDIDILKEYYLVMAKKMHMWGNGL